jgi:hypothetical protein
MTAETPLAHYSAEGKLDGALTLNDSGQSIVTFGNAPPRVSGGKVVHTPIPGSSAAYWETNLDETVDAIGMSVEFPSADSGAIALIVASDSWAARFGRSGFPNAACHFVMGRGHWEYAIWSADSGAEVIASGNLSAALEVGRTYDVGIKLDAKNGKASISLPDGTTTTVSDPRISSYTGSYAIHELYEFDGGTMAGAEVSAFTSDSNQPGAVSTRGVGWGPVHQMERGL